jgi:hypothetical protein
MSVKVDLDRLADELADFTFAYLITVGDDYRAHTVAVDAVLSDGTLEVGTVGNATRGNATAHGEVTLVWPPGTPGGYTLIVDGRGELDGGQLRVVPSRAVLHRKAAPGTATKPGCKDDCLPLEAADAASG